MTSKLTVISIIFFSIILVAAASPLHSLYSPCQEKQSGNYLDISGSKIYYEQCGSGASIVLLHDGLVHAISWDGIWGSLCAKYHVIRYDRRGYGRSDPPKTPFSPTDDLYKLLTHCKLSAIVHDFSEKSCTIAESLPIIRNNFPRMETFGFPLSDTIDCWFITRKQAEVKSDFRVE